MKDIKLSSQRLNLRSITFTDLEKVHLLHSLPETDKFNTLGIPEDLEQTKTVLSELISKGENASGRTYTFAVELQESDEFIGLVALNPGAAKYKNAEVWFKFHSDFWNKGYATEALKLLLDFGFNHLKLHRIEAGCAVDNIGSIRTMEKSGMIREGRKKKALPLKTGWSDNFEYAVLSQDWKY